MPPQKKPSAAVTVEAFVRIRPLTYKESNDQETELQYLTADSTSPLLNGFTGVLGSTTSNDDVFERCLAPKLSTVLHGGAVSIFSYGYTGGGKTHTIVGYGEEKGLYFLAAEWLIRELKVDSREPANMAERDRLFLRVTASEIYDDRVFDLLGQEKLECSLRIDNDGQLLVVGATAQMEQLEGVLAAGGELSTLVTRTTSLRSVSVYEPEHLQEIALSCVSKRATGSSTEHEQSSRSHALLQMEVVTAAVLEAQAVQERAKALVGPLRNDLENAGAAGLADLFSGATGYQDCKFVLRLVGSCQPKVVYITISPFDHSEILWYAEEEGDLEIDNSVTPTRPKEFALKKWPGELKTLDEWAVTLGAGSVNGGFYGGEVAPGTLVRMAVLKRTCFAEAGEWERRREKHASCKAELDARIAKNAATLEAATAALTEGQARGGPAVGGTLMLADLAGADYDHRCGLAQKESAAINKSLLALKECLRALAAAKCSLKPKFRDTKLTRMLEDTLAPNASSKRRNRDIASVMLVNVSPAMSLEQPTLNSLRYGQLFTS